MSDPRDCGAALGCNCRDRRRVANSMPLPPDKKKPTAATLARFWFGNVLISVPRLPVGPTNSKWIRACIVAVLGVLLLLDRLCGSRGRRDPLGLCSPIVVPAMASSPQ